MNDTVLRIYHRLPSAARSLAATARGWQLRSWRYGRETERLVEEAVERESWTPRQWACWQQARLSETLHRAATRVPFYRDAWAARRARGDASSWERLENWPALEKESVRRNPLAFVADDCDPRRMFHEHTSGTSGSPIQLWWSRRTVRAWYALFEARSRRWFGVTRRDRWAILGGQLVAPAASRRPPFWVWNSALNQLYLSSYHLASDLVPYYLEALSRYRVEYLVGYASALNSLAQCALRTGWRAVGIKVAITNAEPLLPYQRSAIAEAFRCPVQETYGMAEIVAAASECPSGRLHLWPEAGYLESGEDGELIATGLLNNDMPLIRYRVGDRVSLGRGAGACACGRALPELESVEGRVDDVLYTSDGRQVGRLDPIFKAELPLSEAQIVQESLYRVRLLFVPDAGWDASAARETVRRIQDRMGAVEVTLERVDAIPRQPNGKFRAVINRMPRAEQAASRG